MAENKTTKKIYINASKVSHFTNFIDSQKKMKILKFYMNTIYGYVNFFILHIKDPISEIIIIWEI